VLFDGLGRARMLFYISSDMHGGDQPQIVEVLFAPAQELAAGASVRFTGVGPESGLRKTLGIWSRRFRRR
jgi:hypothetical protein